MSADNEEVAIRVDGVYKDFNYSSERANTVKSLFTGMFKGVDKNQKTQHALKNISFDIKKGEFFGIVGRNGSGKSTLLKIIAGIYQPSKGKTEVNGKLVPFIELGVGFNPELTGKENVYMNGAMLGFSSKEVDKFYDEVVEFAELGKFMDKKLKNYSSGMQVRLAFSMAIRAKADILLIDEVLAVGDADFQRKCFRYFQLLKKQKQTVVFVSHDMNVVREYCDRVAFIESNKLIKIDQSHRVALMYEQLMAEVNPEIKSDTTEGEVKKRWGGKQAAITNPEFSKTAEGILQLRFTAKANKDCESLIYGFMIKNGAGTQIMGSNTLIEKIKSQPIKIGEKKLITWNFDNILSDGEYYVTLALLLDNGVTVVDWWDEAIKFSIRKATHTTYLVAPKLKVSIV